MFNNDMNNNQNFNNGNNNFGNNPNMNGGFTSAPGSFKQPWQQNNGYQQPVFDNNINNNLNSGPINKAPIFNNVNTLIIYNADRFGLSQLYQIRGRVGRSNKIAYAYLMYSKDKILGDVAVKRLNAIKEFTELGSGFSIASRDLSIRGAGDILGSEQAGFIDSVGIDLYLKILNEEVNRLKGIEPKEENVSKNNLLNVSTHISDNYVEDNDLKIEIHKKINTIDSYDKFIKVKEELTDRFGSLDDDIIIYMLEELFECNAKKKGIFKVIQTEREISVFITNVVSKRQDGANLLSGLFKISPNFEIKYINNILRISLKTNNLEKHFLHYLVKMLDVIE